MKFMKAYKILRNVGLNDDTNQVIEFNEPDIDRECLALFHASEYEKIFGKLKKDMPQNKQRLSVVKISTSDRKIYRQFAGRSIDDLKSDCVGLSPNAWQLLQLDLRKCPCIDVKVEKGSVFMFYWFHSNSATRISFKLGLYSVGLAVVGIIVSILFGIKDCIMCC